MSKINEVAELVEKGKAKLVGPAVQEAIDEGDDPVAILNDGMISAMSVVGEKFKNGEIFVPEMLVAARAMKKGVEVLKPHLASGSTGALGKVIIATVSGDLHDIGKNLGTPSGSSGRGRTERISGRNDISSSSHHVCNSQRCG